jgi:glycine cleavage system regulatory protein
MQRSLVMTMIGPDRPGLVEAVADIVTKHSGNWLDSRMSRLGGHFAGILRVEFPAEAEDKIVQALRALESRGLSVVIHLDHPTEQPAGNRLSEIEIVGHDRPGIVREISHVLASHGVNVEELDTERGSAAMSGESIFKARATLRIPKTSDVAKMRRDLERIAADLIVDISLKERL